VRRSLVAMWVLGLAAALGAAAASGGGDVPAACNSTSFKPLPGQAGMGLSKYPLASTQADCVTACCSDDDCSVWSFAPGSDPALGCWLGQAGSIAPEAAWTSGSRDLPPPTPPPYQLPRLTPFPTSLTLLQQGGGQDDDDALLTTFVEADSIVVDLAGEWDFNPEQGAPAANWTTIQVPGEYTLQGHDHISWPVTYRRNVSLPAAWQQGVNTGLATGLRVKLRCDGVYSQVDVEVNGGLAGHHLGGFTAFELDITSFLNNGSSSNSSNSNELVLSVSGASLADTLASGSRYATHDLGGITRNIYLLTVPTVAVSDVYVRTTQDRVTGAWTATVDVTVANDGAAAAAPGQIVVSLLDSTTAGGGGGAVLAAVTLPWTTAIDAGASATQTATLEVDPQTVKSWDAEHPGNLYNITVQTPAETVVQRVGFRQVATDGNQLVINGRAIKARGSTRHETHQVFGRALGASRQVNLWREVGTWWHTCPRRHDDDRLAG
jgi:hypothetical protein